MRIVNIHAAKTQLSKLLAAVARGEEIVIAKAGKPVAKLVGISSEASFARRPGILRGKVWVDPGWDAVASDPDLLSLFEDSELFPASGASDERPEGGHR